MNKCKHENYDDYFGKCSDCNASREQIIKENFLQELQEVYDKMQKAMGLTGYTKPDYQSQIDEAENNLAEVVANWMDYEIDNIEEQS